MLHLPQLLEYRVRQLKRADEEGKMPSSLRQEMERAEGLCASLRWLYREYSVSPAEWVWYLTDEVEETYVLSDMIRGRRQAMGMSQEKLAEGVCDPVTVSRIESGVVVPKQGVLEKLLEKLHVPGGNAILSAQTGKPMLHRMAEEINLLTSFGRNEEALPLVEKLMGEAGDNLYARQYLLSLETMTRHSAGKLDAASTQERFWEALYMTVPKKAPEDLTAWAFVRQEATIINDISCSCEEIGQRDTGISWLRLLLQYYHKLDPARRRGMVNYEIALRHLGDLLGNRQEYEEAIYIEDLAIRLALETGRANIIRITLYDRTWNME